MHQIAAIKSAVPTEVNHAIRKASIQTGVSFDHLLQQAHAESGFKVNAKATGSTAKGLFQFVEQTWLRLVKSYGQEAGLGAEASAITTTKNGHAVVENSQSRAAILELRNDPEVSAFMAGKFANDNRGILQKALGRAVNGAELALAHFLGAGGAVAFLNALKEAPTQKAADVLPFAAKSNPRVFFTRDSMARTVSEIADIFATKFGHSVGTVQSNTDATVNKMTEKTSDNKTLGRNFSVASSPTSLDAGYLQPNYDVNESIAGFSGVSRSKILPSGNARNHTSQSWPTSLLSDESAMMTLLLSQNSVPITNSHYNRDENDRDKKYYN